MTAFADCPSGRPWWDFGIAAWGYVRLSLKELTSLRKHPASHFPEPATPQFLKHSDEQSIASMAAVYQALEQFGLSTGFERWGIVAAPRFLGRSAMAASMHRFEADGPWGASVQVVPQRSQHSVASILSLMLHIHGPCIGVGCGPRGDAEAMLAAANLLEGDLPGAWLVASGWDPELGIDRSGQPTTDSSCIAAAMALAPNPTDASGGRLRVRTMPSDYAIHAECEFGFLNSLAGLMDYLPPLRLMSTTLIGGSRTGVQWQADLRHPPAVTTIAPPHPRSVPVAIS
jgi:hypothetical protein